MLRTISSRLALALFSMALSMALCATSTHANQTTGWNLRIYPEWVSPDLKAPYGGPFAQPAIGVEGDVTTSFEGRAAVGLGVAAEYRFSERLGLELSLGHAEPDLVFRVRGSAAIAGSFSDGLRASRLGIALPIHLTPRGPVDLWVGPSISYYRFGTWPFAHSELHVSDELGYGLVAGLDIPLTERLALHLGASYHELDIEPRLPGLDYFDGFSLPLDPLTVRLGTTIRF